MILENIKDFPSKQAEELQKHLIELDKQGKLKEKALLEYKDNLGKENSLIRYIIKNWENGGKKLYLEYTGIETFNNKQTIKRTGVKLNEVTYGSNRYFLWKCNKCQYEWTIRAVDRTSETSKHSCPACAGNTLIQGKNDLETYCKEHLEFNYLLDEFIGEDIEGNKVLPSEISKSSNKDVWWRCSKCEHTWIAKIGHRTCKQKQGCPECNNRQKAKVAHLKGEPLDQWCNRQGDYGQQLKEEFLGELADETLIKITDISRGSTTKVKWKCSKCEYIWTASVRNRTSYRRGCPECGKKRTAEASHSRGETLEHWCNRQGEYGAKLKSEFTGKLWNNKIIKIDEINHGNKEKMQWECSKCHRIWLATPNERTSSHRTGCIYCATNTWTSFPEQYIYHSLKQLFQKTKSRAKTKDTHYEYDIAIPEINLCIEYSGYNWHKDRLDKDEIKETYCKSKGINFLQIYAHQGDIINPDIYNREKIIYQVEKDKSRHIKQLQQIIKYILEQYAPNHNAKEIDFTLAEQQANKVMNKA